MIEGKGDRRNLYQQVSTLYFGKTRTFGNRQVRSKGGYPANGLLTSTKLTNVYDSHDLMYLVNIDAITTLNSVPEALWEGDFNSSLCTTKGLFLEDKSSLQQKPLVGYCNFRVTHRKQNCHFTESPGQTPQKTAFSLRDKINSHKKIILKKY